MAITHRASTGLAAGTTTTGGAFTLPTGHTTDDLLLAWLGVKAYTVGISSGTLTTDYTSLGDITSGTVANGVGVGSTRTWAYHRTHDGSETAPACTLDAAPSPSMKAMSAYSKTNAGAWDIASATGADTSASGTSVSIASGTTIDLAVGDVLLVVVSLPDDTATMATSLALSATGITFGTINERLPTNGTTSGNDGIMHVFEAEVTAGSGTVTVTLSGTNTNSGESEASAVFVRLREPSSSGATVNGVAAPLTLGSTVAHSIVGGGRVDGVAATETLGSTTSHTVRGAGRVDGVAAAMTLGSTSPSIVGGASVAATAGTETFGTTTHTITGGVGSGTVNAVAASATLGTTAPTIRGGASVAATAGTATLGTTSHTVRGGASVAATAGGETLGTTSHTITGGAGGGASVAATTATMNLPTTTAFVDQAYYAPAATMTLGTTNVIIEVDYYAIAGEMLLGGGTHTITGSSNAGSVLAVAAGMLLEGGLADVTVPIPVLVRLESTELGSFTEVERKTPYPGSRWTGLWPRLNYPSTQRALLLYRSGVVTVVESVTTREARGADAIVGGGYIWMGMSDSWEANVLRAAGYTLVPVESEV